MLGWEYPPEISGGLGKACAGIAHGLSMHAVEVLFVVPHAARDPRGAEAHGARGRPTVKMLELDQVKRQRTPPPTTWFVDSPLRPYMGRESYVEQLPSGGESHYGQDLGDEVQRYAEVLEETLASHSFDLVHAHDWMTFPAGLVAKERTGKPLVCQVHACEFDRNGWRIDPRIRDIEQWGFAGADRVVCVSGFSRDKLLRHYEVEAGKLRVVHHGADQPAGERRDGPRSDSAAPVILFLGRMTSQKGPAIFLEAAARVLREEPEAKFVMAGDGSLFGEMVELAAELGIARSVHFTGFLTGGDLERILAAADLFVMPSVSEPFGLATLEALMADVPVIITRQSGVAEVLGSCPRFDYWDTDGLTREVLRLLRDPVLRSRLAREGRAEARALRWEDSAGSLVTIYRELLE